MCLTLVRPATDSEASDGDFVEMEIPLGHGSLYSALPKDRRLKLRPIASHEVLVIIPEGAATLHVDVRADILEEFIQTWFPEALDHYVQFRFKGRVDLAKKARPAVLTILTAVRAKQPQASCRASDLPNRPIPPPKSGPRLAA